MGSAAEIALEVSRLQASLLEKLEEEMRGTGGHGYLKTAQDLAKAFGAVTAAAIDPLSHADSGSLAGPGLDSSPAADPAASDRRTASRDPRLPPTQPDQTLQSERSEARSAGPVPEPGGQLHEVGREAPEPGRQASDGPRGPGLQIPPLYRSPELRRRLAQLIETYKRHGHPFGLAVFDVDGPDLREDDGSAETVRTVLGVALHDSVRLIDDSFRLEEDGLCVLAPYQDTVGGVQMAERLLDKLEGLEAVGGLKIAVTAGVVACPEHGIEAKQLLEGADEAMWRARAVGEPVGVGALQAR